MTYNFKKLILNSDIKCLHVSIHIVVIGCYLCVLKKLLIVILNYYVRL